MGVFAKLSNAVIKVASSMDEVGARVGATGARRVAINMVSEARRTRGVFRSGYGAGTKELAGRALQPFVGGNLSRLAAVGEDMWSRPGFRKGALIGAGSASALAINHRRRRNR